MDYYVTILDKQNVIKEVGEKSPVGKEFQTIGPNSMFVQQANNGVRELGT